MNNFIISSNKENYLVDILCKVKSQECDLTILSCYIHPDSILSLIDRIREYKTLQTIRILCDRKESSKILSFEHYKKIQENNISIYVINTGKLFHPKAFCLSNLENENGILCISSANLTKNGITETEGNTEIFIESDNIDSIKLFLQDVSTLLENKKNKDVFQKAIDFSESKSDRANFIYALLKLGSFCHKWKESMSDQFKITYNLTELGRSAINNKYFTARRFTSDAQTLSKTYITQKQLLGDIDIENKNITKINSLIEIALANYAIESSLGYWIPKRIADHIKKNTEKIEEFKKLIESQIVKHTDINSKIIEELHDDVLWLINDNKDFPYITSVFSEKIEAFRNTTLKQQKSYLSEVLREKTNKLFKEDVKLRRICAGVDLIDLPYSIESKNELEALYSSLKETTAASQKLNPTKKAFVEADYKNNLSIFYKSIYLIKIESKYLGRSHGFLSKVYIPKILQKQEIKFAEKINLAFKTSDFQEALKLQCALSNSKISEAEKDFLHLENSLRNCKIYKQWSSVIDSEGHDFSVEIEDIEKELWEIERLLIQTK